MKCGSYYSFFVNLANGTRFSIIMALREKPLSVTEIVSQVGEEQSTISHNLRKLSECHILEVEQSGRERIYSLNKETIIPLLSLVDKHVKKNCCVGCSKK